MIIPDEEGCMALLEKFNTPEHIVLHSRKVWDVARVVAEGLLRNDHSLQMELLRASCLLHDIAKYPCIVERKGFHDVVGGEMLVEEGLPEVARIVDQHVILRDVGGDVVGEEHVLFYADKRVVHDRLVTLEERFEYLANTYGKTPFLLDRLSEMRDRTFLLEKRIFRLLDFNPEDLADLIETREAF
jgi:HD superfamily phosphodiesterase